MKLKADVARYITTKDVVTSVKTFEKAADEEAAYVFLKAGTGITICVHGEKAYAIIEDGDKIGCSCESWTYAHDNDGCKHIAVFMKREPIQKPVTEEIAKALMQEGWTGRKGDLRPPETTSDPDGEDNDGSDPVPEKAQKPEPEPTGAKTATVEPKKEGTKMDNEKPTSAKRVYEHPDGTEFKSAEALLNYVDSLNAAQMPEPQEPTQPEQGKPFLSSMIKNIGTPQLSEVGGIRIGKKRKGGGAETFDHFIFTTPDKDPATGDFYRDEAMTALYGDDCRELPVRFLSDNITEIFTTFYAEYGAGGIKIRGDGENWIVSNPDGSKTYIEDPNGEHGFLKNPNIKPHGILTVLVDGQKSVGTVYRFRTTGWYSINGMLASLALCAKIAERAGGRIAFLPMLLVYRTKEVTPKGERYKKTIPVITAEFRGTIEELQQKSGDATAYLGTSSPQLPEGIVYDPNEDESPEEQEDVRAEFFPGSKQEVED